MDTFYLGGPAYWLPYSPVPLFVSANAMRKDRPTKPAGQRYAIDSGAFTHLQKHGRWVIGPEQYADEVQAWQGTLGPADFVAIQDWMVEPFMLARTGRTMQEHQERTVANFLRLRELAPQVPWLPVLQGWQLDDYLRCLAMYRQAGHEGTRFGAGSVCKRQGRAEIHALLRVLASEPLELHGFGVKVTGLMAAKEALTTADSYAWSYEARMLGVKMEGCEHPGKTCNFCLRYALDWRQRLLQRVAHQPNRQGALAL